MMASPGLRAGSLALLALLLAQGAAAQQADPAEAAAVDLEELREERKRRAQLYPVSRRVSRYLAAAAEEVDAGKPEEGTRLLKKLRPKRLNPLERALVYRLLAFIAYSQEDYPEAIAYFQKVLDEQIMQLRDDSRIRFNIAQLYASQQQWDQVIAWIEKWLRYVEAPDPLGYYMMGIAYYQLKNPDAAIEQTLKAVRATDEPKEAWLRLLAALYAQKEDYEKATPVLEELVLRYPKKGYWVQLSLIYGARENYRRSLAVQQLAYAQGLLTEDKELRRLARSYLFRELPYPAAKVLEKGLQDGSIERDSEALELLANSWVAAREYDRALGPLQEAAELAESGNLYVRLGQVHMQREEWSQAIDRLQKAIAKGGLDNPGNAELLLGISFYNDERVANARSSFARARRYDKTRKEADRWIQHLAKETQEG